MLESDFLTTEIVSVSIILVIPLGVSY